MPNPPNKKSAAATCSKQGSTPGSKGMARLKKKNPQNDENHPGNSVRIERSPHQQSTGASLGVTNREEVILQDNINMAELKKKYAEMKAALAKERANNIQLREQLSEGGGKNESDGREERVMIPRPKGTAGSDFSIQVGMGLAGQVNSKKYDIYKAIQRNVRDLMLNARINWELPWANIPSKDKAVLFDVAREQHPFLERFVNDWATEELVKQYMKNKRKNHYKNGWLDVPAKYSHLKENAMKRDPTASRKKKALLVAAAAKKATKKATSKSRKGKGKVAEVSSDEDDEDIDVDSNDTGEEEFGDEQMSGNEE